MQRIRYGYELCPNHVRAGVINYNKGSMEFENGSMYYRVQPNR